ncbi:MAG: type II secretion system F family protein [Candidatus Pacearchaeota archaeon]
MKKIETPITDIKKKILLEMRILEEMKSIQKSLKNAVGEEKKKLESHMNSLELYLKKIKDDIVSSLENVRMNMPLQQNNVQQAKIPNYSFQTQQKASEYIEESPGFSLREIEHKDEDGVNYKEEEADLEKKIMKRLKTTEIFEVMEKKLKKPSSYVKNASGLFADYSRKLVKKGYFKDLEKDLIRGNMEFVTASYVAVMIYTMIWASAISLFIFLFFLFFNLGVELPIITLSQEDFAIRLLKTFWILLVIPVGTFIAMYFYPSLERQSAEHKINQELPFATIHMSAISGSLIDPTKIFKIIIDTGEYPAVSKEYTKLINQINVYGYDLVGALRNMAFNSPSRKMADLFNSLATAITSGGSLTDFFDKRASSLMFEHKLEKEKQAKAAETFMDIYISVVIAAPMILMLLLMMLKIGGLGIGLSTGAITTMMVLGVVMINIFFLTFLHLKQAGGE